MGSSWRSVPDSPPSALDSMLGGIVRLMGARGGLVRTRVGPSDESRLVAACGLSDEVLKHEMSIAGPCGICGEALHRKCARVSDSVTRDRLMMEQTSRPACTATVAFPLDHLGSNVGVFALFFDSSSRLRKETMGLLQPVGQLLAFGVERARCNSSADQLLRKPWAHQRVLAEAPLAQSRRPTQSRMPLRKRAIQQDGRSDPIQSLPDIEEGLREEILESESAARLTGRESEVLKHIALGGTNKEIARTLGISHDTVKVHVHRIFAKLGVSTRVQAALFRMKQ